MKPKEPKQLQIIVGYSTKGVFYKVSGQIIPGDLQKIQIPLHGVEKCEPFEVRLEKASKIFCKIFIFSGFQIQILAHAREQWEFVIDKLELAGEYGTSRESCQIAMEKKDKDGC